MDQRFKNIKVIAWDVDTTMYKDIPELSMAFRDGCIAVIAEAKILSFSAAEQLFETERAKYNSSSLVLKTLGFDVKKIIPEIQRRINKTDFIKEDPKLLPMFLSLKNFRHFIISNAMVEDDRATLKKLGVPVAIFERIITAQDCQEPKPDPEPFRLLLKITGLPADQHVYIGDRELVDIAPAKKLGMKTILVWGESKIADLSLPTVYDVANVFRA